MNFLFTYEDLSGASKTFPINDQPNEFSAHGVFRKYKPNVNILSVGEIFKDEKKLQNRRTGRESYIQNLLASRRPENFIRENMQEFYKFANLLRWDRRLKLTYSSSSSLSDAFRDDYELRAGSELGETGDVLETTAGIKLNVVCSPKTVQNLGLSGVIFKPFFGDEEQVIGFGDRAGLWWSLIDVGFRRGTFENQDQERISHKLPHSVLAEAA